MTITLKEWFEEAERLFGPGHMHWQFICPSCGNVQSMSDFQALQIENLNPELAYLNCIGRYDGHMDVDICSGQSPCNYTSGGLFNLNPVLVDLPDGKTIRVFAFAEPKEQSHD